MERNTQQRQAIFQVLKDAGRPLSVQEVLELAQERCQGLGVATVYRNLKALVSDDKLVSVDMPGNLVLYELSRQKHHHHFSCVSCSKVFDIDACGLNLKKLIPDGFRLQQHEILLSGFCSSCSSSA